MEPHSYPLDLALSIMREQGISQKSVAEALSLPGSAVSNMFKGKRRLRFEEGKKLDALLGVRLSFADREVPLFPLSICEGSKELPSDSSKSAPLFGSLVQSDILFVIEVDRNNPVGRFDTGDQLYIERFSKGLYPGYTYLIRRQLCGLTLGEYSERPASFHAKDLSGDLVSFQIGNEPIEVVGVVRASVSGFPNNEM